MSLLSFKEGLRPFHFYSDVMYLHRVVKQYDCDIVHKHNKKLTVLYGTKVYTLEPIDNIINLSDYSLQHGETSLLNMGLGLGLKPQTLTIQLQIQMEKLYTSILDHEQCGDITIVNNEHLKTKLKCFGIKHQPTDHFDPLTKEQKSALQKL